MLTRALSFLFFLSALSQLFAQTPELIYDFNQTKYNQRPVNFKWLDSSSFTFEANTQRHGKSLWISDGTIIGTKQFHDFDTLNKALTYTVCELTQNTLVYSEYFSAYQLRIFNKNSQHFTPINSEFGNGFEKVVNYFTKYNNAAYFAGKQPGHLYYDLWKLNDGDSVAKVIMFGDSLQIVYPLAVYPSVNGILFVHSTNAYGKELWKVDNSPKGASLLKDVTSGPSSGVSNTVSSENGHVLFLKTGTSDWWKSDGTDTGTKAITAFNNTPYGFIQKQDSLYIFLTEANTSRLLSMNLASMQLDTLYTIQLASGDYGIGPINKWSESRFIAYLKNNQTFYLDAADSLPIPFQLPLYDSTLESEMFVDCGHRVIYLRFSFFQDGFQVFLNNKGNWTDISGQFEAKPQQVYVHNGRYYFTLPVDGKEILFAEKLQSNAFEIERISELLDETESSNHRITNFNNHLYLSVGHGENYKLLQLDGVKKPREIAEYSNTTYLYYFDSTLAFNISSISVDSARAVEFIPDGSREARTYNFSSFSFYSSIYKVGQRYFFTVGNGKVNNELWCFDTTNGFNVYHKGYRSTILGVFQGKLYYQIELNSSSAPDPVFVVDNINYSKREFIFQTNGKRQDELYNFYPLDSQFYFTLDDSAYGRELWVSDGTAQGTRMVINIFPGMGKSNPNDFNHFGDSLYFTASHQRGSFLYALNMRNLNVRLISDTSDVWNNSLSNSILGLWDSTIVLSFSRGNKYFQVVMYHIGTGEFNFLSDSLASIGRTLECRTKFRPIPNSVDGNLLFVAEDPIHGRELWKTNGTKTGTYMVADIFPGPDDGSPYFQALKNDTLYFVAINPDYGAELWRYHAGCLYANFKAENTCSNEITDLKSEVLSYGQDSIGITWIINSKDTLIADSISYSFLTSGSHLIQMEAANQNCSKLRIDSLFIADRTFATLNLNSDSQCFEGNRFIGQVSDANPKKTFNWQWGDFSTSLGNQSEHKFYTVGNYDLIIIGSEQNACFDTIIKKLRIHPNPPNPTIIGPLYSEQAIDTLYSTYYPNTSYEWSSDAGQLTKTLNDSSAIFKWDYPTGFATVRLTFENQFGCLSKQSSHIIQRKQLRSLTNQGESSLLLYPNPTKDLISLQALNQIIQSVKIFDMSGKLLMENVASSNQSEMSISLNSLLAGIYMVQVQVNGEVFNRIISKQ